MKWRIVTVDNDNFLLELLCDYFEASKKYHVVGCTANAQEAFALCCNHFAHVVLMDISTDDGKFGGIRSGAIIKRVLPHIKVILITGLPEVGYIQQAKDGKIDSFLYKTDTIENLYHAVEETMQGKHIWPEENLPTSDSSALSERELEIARMICCQCLSRREIADILQLSPNSGKTYTHRIYNKVNVNSFRELMKYMLVNDLILSDDES